MFGEYTQDLSRNGWHIVSDSGPDMSCEQITLLQSAEPYPAGSVLMSDGAGGATHSDGTNANGLIGLLLDAKDATDGAVRAVAHVRLAVYKTPGLQFLDAVTDPEKATAVEALKAMNLIGVDAS